MLDEIFEALAQSHPADRQQIRNYIAWLQFRRRVHYHFYYRAHWVTQLAPDLPGASAHWI